MLNRGSAIKGTLFLGVLLLASPAHAAGERERSRREFVNLLLLLEKNANQTPVVATSNSIVARGVTATSAALTASRTVSSTQAKAVSTATVRAEAATANRSAAVTANAAVQLIRRLVLQENALTTYGLRDVRAQNAAIIRLAVLERIGVTTPAVEAAIARQEASIATTQLALNYDAGRLFIQQATISQTVASLAPILQSNPAGVAIMQRVVATQEAAAANAYQVVVRGAATPSM